MKIRVDHREMTNVINKLSNESNMLTTEIENIQKNIEELKTVWQGEEANIFYTRITNYLNKMEAIPATYDKMSSFLSRSNSRYKEMDNAFLKDIENVRING